MSDSIFTIHYFQIKKSELNKPIYIIPFGDTHRFAPLCDVGHWQRFLSWAKEKDNAYFLGMGDYDDFLSSKERLALNAANFHESTRQSIDEMMQERTDKLCKEISFMKGKLIGLLEGNHHGQFQTGMTTTQELCRQLGCKYLGVSSFIRIKIENHNAKTRCVDIWAHHGRGASRLVGGSLNCVQQMIDSADADIYLMGHDHKKSIAFKSRLFLANGGGGLQLRYKKILMGRTGSFLKGYVPDEPSYVVRNALSPTDLGVIKIELTPRRTDRKEDDQYYIDIHASV